MGGVNIGRKDGVKFGWKSTAAAPPPDPNPAWTSVKPARFVVPHLTYPLQAKSLRGTQGGRAAITPPAENLRTPCIAARCSSSRARATGSRKPPRVSPSPPSRHNPAVSKWGSLTGQWRGNLKWPSGHCWHNGTLVVTSTPYLDITSGPTNTAIWGFGTAEGEPCKTCICRSSRLPCGTYSSG